jgi:hypothetical protein
MLLGKLSTTVVTYFSPILVSMINEPYMVLAVVMMTEPTGEPLLVGAL